MAELGLYRLPGRQMCVSMWLAAESVGRWVTFSLVTQATGIADMNYDISK